MSKQYKLSIIIPTKNRAKYCLAAIRQISKDVPNAQIVIQDNSDTRCLEEDIVSLSLENVLYHYHEGAISFVDNFSEAISFASGEYLCMIGDDDGVLSNIMDVVVYAEQNGYDAVVPALSSVYTWPSATPFIKNAENGYLCFAYAKPNVVKEISAKKGLKQLLALGGQDYQSCELPRLYHGLVKRSALEKVYQKVGTYFKGLTPDIYMAVALSAVCEKVAKLEYPFTVSGICPGSGSSNSATGKHTGELKDAPHFIGHTDYIWDEKAPAIYSVESIWAETVMKALFDFDMQKEYEAFRIDVLDAICLRKYPQFKSIIIQHAKLYKVGRCRLFFVGIGYATKKLFLRVWKRLTGKKGSVKKLYHILDIESAVTTTEELLSKA